MRPLRFKRFRENRNISDTEISKPRRSANPDNDEAQIDEHRRLLRATDIWFKSLPIIDIPAKPISRNEVSCSTTFPSMAYDGIQPVHGKPASRHALCHGLQMLLQAYQREFIAGLLQVKNRRRLA